MLSVTVLNGRIHREHVTKEFLGVTWRGPSMYLVSSGEGSAAPFV